MKKILSVLIAVSFLASAAHAIPVLQLYVEGSTYDEGTETWVLTGAGDPVTLWTIGNVDGPGSHGSIHDVRLSIAYADPGGAEPTISLTPTTTGGLGGFTDPSTPGAPTYIQTVTDGSSPVLEGGGSMGPHGIYGSGTHWQEFLLGDFTLTDSPMADFISAFPSADFPGTGQINAYEIIVDGPTVYHLDLYGYTGSGDKTKPRFAPFSHDVSVIPNPEPATVALLGLGLLGLGARFRRKK
jgi:hypothetical protein